MNSENWKTGAILENKQNLLENILNSTKTEVQNGIRALMLLIGKISNKEQLPQDQGRIDQLNGKIDANFEKLFSAQNLFMDNCYRLQMDESQIESKISDILEKLMETFEKKTAIEIKDIKNLEKLIKSHDAHVKRNLHQTSTNVVTVYEKLTKDHQEFETDLKQVINHLNALFSLVQDTLADENGSLSAKNVNILLHDLNEMEKKITSLNKQGDVLTNSVDEIKGIVETLGHKNSSQVTDAYFKNISQIITGMEAKINTAYLYYYYNRSKINAINQNMTQKLQELFEIMDTNPTTDANQVEVSSTTNDAKNEKIRKIVAEIFGVKLKSNETLQDHSQNEPQSDFLKLIDVRTSLDDEIENNTTELKLNSVNDEQTTTDYYDVKLGTEQTPIKLNESGEYEDFDLNWQQVSV